MNNSIVFNDFVECIDPVKTEKLIFDQLKTETIKTDYIYIVFPIAWTINNYGIHYVQAMLNEIHKKHGNQKLFFVCQHVQVENLDFHGHLVFTPHATRMDNYVSIPHYAANFFPRAEQKEFNNREILMGFRGAFLTHSTRSKLKLLLGTRKDCEIIDTGHWHFEMESQKERQDKYIASLNNTKIALCPRGTGPSTIRIWEAMASGCVPLIISNYLKMPLENQIDWNKCIINVSEGDIIHLEKKIPNNDILEQMSIMAKKTYYEHFSNENLFKTIKLSIQG